MNSRKSKYDIELFTPPDEQVFSWSSKEDFPFLQPPVPNDTSQQKGPSATSSNKTKSSVLSSSKKTPIEQRNVKPHHSVTISDGAPSSHTISTPARSGGINIIAIVEGRGIAKGEIGLACIDLKNPVMMLSQFADTQAYVRLATQLNILNPVEIIIPSTLCEGGSQTKLLRRISELFPDMTTITIERRYFNETKGLECVQELCASEFKTVEVEVVRKYYCLAACAALVRYIEFIENVTYAPNSLKIVYSIGANTTMISTSTACRLELASNELGKMEHTLCGVLNYTFTPGGNRLLRANVLQPPCDIDTINPRLDCISEMIDNEDLFFNLRSIISRFVDTEQLLSLFVMIPKMENIRLAEQNITNIIRLKHSLDLIGPLVSYLTPSKDSLLQTYCHALSDERFAELHEKLELVIHSDTTFQKGVLNMRMQKCFAVKPNINGLLDVARRTYTEVVNDIAEYVKQLTETYNLPFHLNYTSLRGFYIQILKKALSSEQSLPTIFTKVVTTKTTITFTSEDLIKMNDRVRESLNEIYLMSNIIISEVLNEIRGYIGCLYKLCEAISSIDFLLSLAHACTLSEYVRPQFSEELAIKNGRHPVVEKFSSTTFVANNTFLCEELNFNVITGINMSGKTTYLKQVALLQIMAQIGSYVPAEYAMFRLTDQILSLLGSTSDMERNYSTFAFQMKEATCILQHATERSLIILDELGYDTSYEDGCGMAYAICEELLRTKAFILCSTHFKEFNHLESVYPNVSNYHFNVDYSVQETGEGCVCNFTYNLVQGSCEDKHYGIKIAKISALPPLIVCEANKLITNMSKVNVHNFHPDPVVEENRQKVQLVIHLAQLARSRDLSSEALLQHLQELQDQFCGSRNPIAPPTPVMGMNF